MNSSVDSTELLGGFEQFDVNRHKKKIIADLECLVYQVLRDHLLLRSGEKNMELLITINDLWCVNMIAFINQLVGTFLLNRKNYTII